ncbi:MAG: hypothetical protein ROO76_22160 [Terriglobia bacterium]|jgi:hypothetical protein|nr:hypothetical protein [Terriglobia bacterium]
MAEKNRTGDLRPNRKDDIKDRDPEFEVPDPEQVEEDREEAERIYNDQPKKPAA